MMLLRISLCGYIFVLLLVLVVLTYGRPSNTHYARYKKNFLQKHLLQHQGHNGHLPRQIPRQQRQYHSSSSNSNSMGTKLGRSRRRIQFSRRRRLQEIESRPAVVQWGKECSPRKAWVRPNSDVSLECEVLAPAGSLLIWKKDGQPVYLIHKSPRNMLDNRIRQSLYVDHSAGRHGNIVDNSIRQSLYRDQSVGNHGTVHMSSRVYIDCADEEHEGTYTLEVHAPNGQMFLRSFTVQLAEHAGDPIGMFCHDLSIVPYIPRIYEYARAFKATIGQDIILPCKVMGNNHTVTWHFMNRQLPLNDQNFKIHVNGDLLIRKLSSDYRGVFTCQTTSTIVPELTDISFTSVYPIVPQEEQTNEINQNMENINT